MYKYVEKNIDELLPYINNSRTHSPEQVSKINKIGADMYKGKKREKQAMTSDQLEQRECDTHLHAPFLEV